MPPCQLPRLCAVVRSNGNATGSETDLSKCTAPLLSSKGLDRVLGCLHMWDLAANFSKFHASHIPMNQIDLFINRRLNFNIDNVLHNPIYVYLLSNLCWTRTTWSILNPFWIRTAATSMLGLWKTRVFEASVGSCQWTCRSRYPVLILSDHPIPHRATQDFRWEASTASAMQLYPS